MTAAAVSCTFSDFRIVKGRKVVQIILECPLEQADHALLALGGIPMPDQTRWVAVARMQSPAPEPAKEPRPWKSLPYCQQASIRINDPKFREWLQLSSVEEADQWVKARCGVGSKRDLDGIGRTSWEALDREYMIATGLMVEPR